MPSVADAKDIDVLEGVAGDRRRYLMHRFAWPPWAIHTLTEAKAPFSYVGHGPLEMSSCFSGLETPEVADESLVDAMRLRFNDRIFLVSNAAFDINKSSRSVLIQDQSI